MWHGEQSPGGGQNQQGQNQPGQTPQGQNPYRQPGYQQPNPYGQQATWNAPTMPGGPQGAAPEPPHGDKGSGGRTKLIAMVAAGAVVVAAGVTGALLLGGDKDDSAKPGPAKSSASPDATASASASASANPRTGDGMPEPTVPGWKVVVNPKLGIAFDVPPEWSLESRDWAGGVVEDKDAEDDTAPFLAAYAAPAYFKEKWCVSDDDKDGIKDDTAVAAAGTRGGRGVKSTEGAARHDAVNWVYGVYTQPDRKKVTMGPTEVYTTGSGLKGTLVTASSAGAEKRGKCGSDGKAAVFAFKTPEGGFASWSFHGAKDVKDELPDETVREIVATVRLYEPVQD
ncbi:hypothetical protein [Streptomyces sp. NPDC020607]|uniref:hypothetical protein n=1 Tax=Streptomyces sp. NPDC020607 TaxID=3365082 RepID=UPI0037A48643